MRRQQQRQTRSSSASVIGAGAVQLGKCVSDYDPPSENLAGRSQSSSNLDQASHCKTSILERSGTLSLKRKPLKDVPVDASNGEQNLGTIGIAKKIDLGKSVKCDAASSETVATRQSPRKRAGGASKCVRDVRSIPDVATPVCPPTPALDGEEVATVKSLPTPPSPDLHQDHVFHADCMSSDTVLPQPLTPPKGSSVASISADAELSTGKEDPYQVGDIVWACVASFPRWPAMLSNDPDSDECRDSRGRLHLQFFGEKVERAWVNVASAKPFSAAADVPSFKEACKSRRRRSGVTMERSWKLACAQAEEALALDGPARREKYSVVYAHHLPSQTLSSPTTSPVSKTPSEVTPSASVDDPLARKRAASANAHSAVSPKKPRRSSSTAARKSRSASSSAASNSSRSASRRTSSTGKSQGALSNCLEAEQPSDNLEVERSEDVPSKGRRQSSAKPQPLPLPVCSACGNDAGPENTVTCSADCGDRFHLECLGLDAAATDFKCDICVAALTSCGVCRSNAGTLKTCATAGCPKRYHVECLRGFPATKWPGKTRFVCPQHMCATCSSGNGRMDRCAQCPAAFHSTPQCLPAGYRRLNDTRIVCLRHQSTPPPIHLLYCYECGHTGTPRLNCAYCPQSIEPACLHPNDSASVEPPSPASSASSNSGEQMPVSEAPAPPVAASKSSVKQQTPKWVCSDCQSGSSLRFGDIVHCKIGYYRWWPAKIVHEDEIPENLAGKQPGVGHFLVYFYGSGDYAWANRGRTIPFNGKHDMPRKGGKFSDAYTAGFAEAKEEWMNRKKTMKPYEHVKVNVCSAAATSAGAYRKQKVPECMCTADDPCSETSGCLNYVANYECDRSTCPVGAACQNRRMQQRKGRRLKIVSEGEKGYGVRCQEDVIKAGEYVIEYTGEVMLEDEFRKRLAAFLDEGEDACFYFMRLGSRLFLDAALKGNASRFINHSCSPNLCTEQWVVQGRPHIGLFALKDIQKGDELSFDYQLDYCGLDQDRFTKCLCGAANCSGFLGIRPKNSKNEKAPKADKKKKKKVKKAKAKRAASEWEDECFECSEESGDLVMCDYPKCPKVYHVKCLQMEKVPNSSWWCPYHVCDECSTKAVEFCSFCSSSCCLRHPQVLRCYGDADMICSRHDEFDALPPRERVAKA